MESEDCYKKMDGNFYHLFNPSSIQPYYSLLQKTARVGFARSETKLFGLPLCIARARPSMSSADGGLLRASTRVGRVDGRKRTPSAEAKPLGRSLRDRGPGWGRSGQRPQAMPWSGGSAAWSERAVSRHRDGSVPALPAFIGRGQWASKK